MERVEEPDLGEVRFYCPLHGAVEMVKRQGNGSVGVCYIGDDLAMTQGRLAVDPFRGLEFRVMKQIAHMRGVSLEAWLGDRLVG